MGGKISKRKDQGKAKQKEFASRSKLMSSHKEKPSPRREKKSRREKPKKRAPPEGGKGDRHTLVSGYSYNGRSTLKKRVTSYWKS